MKHRRIKDGIQFDGYVVLKRKYSGSMWNHIEQWATENCTGKICCSNYLANSRLFVFDDPIDAMAFKLRWT